MAYYDDVDFSYDRFWVGRQYEHASEILALEKLVGERKLGTVVDIGGGFGRLTKWLMGHSHKVYLVEPSAKMRQAAKKYLAKYPRVSIRPGKAEDSNLPKACADLVMMVRVLHHLPESAPALAEANRILKPGGLLVLEFANSIHLKARLKSWLTGQPILPTPLERRSSKSIASGTIPFVNHHPLTVLKRLKLHGFKATKVLSVSNLRSSVLKSLIPLSFLLGLESWLQTKFSSLYLGPSIWLLAKKIDKQETL